MIKVLQVYDSIAVSSGVSSVLMSWLNNIKNREIKMDFLCCWKREPSYERDIIGLGSKVFYIESIDGISNYISFIKKVKLFMEKYGHDYDIIHLHSSIFSYPILYYAKKYGISERIVHVHSSSLGNRKLSEYRNLLSLYPMKIYANHYWACSKEAAKVWYKGIDSNTIDIINNGIDISSFERDPDSRRQFRYSWKIDGDTIVLGHISNMSNLKNVPFILRVLKEIIKINKNFKLVLIGKTTLPENIYNYIKENNLENYVINAGVSNCINKCIQAIDIGVMPSLSEGYGLVPIEFEAAGIPVLVSDGFPDIISSSFLAIKLELDEKLWCRQILELSKSQKIYEVKNSLDKFEITRICKKVSELYLSYIRR